MQPWDSSLRPPGDDAPIPVVSGVSVSERYDVRELLGRGGMARVYRAVERASGRVVALKRLEQRDSPERRLRTAVLFEREYRALSQLAHPRVVEVYDYGVDAEGPYYTLELLNGGDLQELAPVGWRDACQIARDVCSALSLLHSRRLVHRDVSPRNVRRTPDGASKLIDFGAVAPMGPNKWLVGTPPCCAPESLQLQALDARTDLFALGATLYFVLTGRHAFAARSFAEVASVWQHGFALPSQLQPDIPPALDALVADLLQLEPDARPANAAEVIERLCAIDGHAHVEHLQVAHAYLAMPPMIGRSEQLSQLHAALTPAILERSRGAVCVIEGESGVGRSRLLDACLLDAALRGAVCVRSDAEDAAHGDYGVLGALVRQLHLLLPELSHASSQGVDLSVLLPAPNESGVLQDNRELRPQLQAAVLHWLTALASKRALVLAVDDCQRADEPSIATLALIASQMPSGIGILLSAESDASWTSRAARPLLLAQAQRIALQRLNPEQSEQLVAALFNHAPNARSLAHRLHEVASGKPRDLMALAEHLVARGGVRYEGGAWTVPARVDQIELPSSMAQALHARLENLGAAARELGAALAICPDNGFTGYECGQLLDFPDRRAREACLEELTAAGILRVAGEQYRLPHAQWVSPLRAQLTPERERALCRRLSRVFAQRQLFVRASQQLFRAGDDSAGLDVLVEHSRVSQNATATSQEEFMRYARALAADWFETFERGLQLCDSLGRPPRDKYWLLGRLSGLMPAFGVPGRAHFSTLIKMLEHAGGYSDYMQLDPQLPAEQRAEQALALAKARYERATEAERVIEPMTALRMLLRTLVSAASAVALGVDLPFLRSFPDLSGFAKIAPGATIVSSLMAGMLARYSGRLELLREIYMELLDRTTSEAGMLDPSHLNVMRLAVMNGLAVTEACMGMASSLQWSERTAVHPAYRLNSLQSRMLYRLYMGDIEQVEETVRQIERLRVQTLQLYETSNLLWEIGAHVICEDLTRLRRCLEAVAPVAKRYESWRAVQHYVTAEYQRVRRDPARALTDNEAALAMTDAGDHPLWAAIASSHVRTLSALGRHSDALRACESYVSRARRAQLGFMAEELHIALALCQAGLKQPAAMFTADAVIERLRELDVHGIWLGLAHEARARVALALEDRPGFESHLQSARNAYGAKHPALRAKLRRLSQEAERRANGGEQLPMGNGGTLTSHTGVQLLASLDHCSDNMTRAQLTLSVLCRQTAARGGLMYLLIDDHLELITTSEGQTGSVHILESAQSFLESHAQASLRTLTGDDASEGEPAWPEQLAEYRPLLLSHEQSRGLVLTGVVVLAQPAQGFAYPARLLAALSRFWAGTGEVSTLLAVADD